MTLETADPAGPPAQPLATVERPTISVLGIRRRYWEMTHGWIAPANSRAALEVDVPERVA